LLGACALALPVRAEEMVTIPKARLQELENKEAQLEKLKMELGKAHAEREQLVGEQQHLKAEAEQLKQAKTKAEAKAAAVSAAAKVEPIIPHNTPPMDSLPAFQKGQVVDAMDLMNHYRANAVMAKQRYERHPIRVEGEIMGFEKPMFVRPYVIRLKTTERAWNVLCRVEAPEVYSAVFTVKSGEQIVGSTSAGARTTLASVGQKIVVEGRCTGLNGQAITLTSCMLVPQ
jgi:regulator of replication initiation timing